MFVLLLIIICEYVVCNVYDICEYVFKYSLFIINNKYIYLKVLIIKCIIGIDYFIFFDIYFIVFVCWNILRNESSMLYLYV